MDLSFLNLDISHLEDCLDIQAVEKEEEFPSNSIFGYFINHKDEYNDWSDLILKNPENLKEVSRRVEPDTYYPYLQNVFDCLKYTKLKDLKVCIWGQDPYPNLDKNGKPQAVGMSFSSNRDGTIPVSLKNIYKQLRLEWSNLYKNSKIDTKGRIKESLFEIPNHPDLKSWCEQGVLLANQSWTYCNVEGDKERYMNTWKPFVHQLIGIIDEHCPNCVHIMWGNKAQKLDSNIMSKNKITGAHPSGFSFSRFYGGNYFVRTNIILEESGRRQIDWRIEDSDRQDSDDERKSRPTTIKNLRNMLKKY